MRCEHLTIQGKQCKREAQEGSKYCWQHQPFKGQKEEKPRSISASPRSSTRSLRSVSSPRSASSSSSSPSKSQVDEKEFVRLIKHVQKGTLTAVEEEQKIARGPLTLKVESVYYVRLPFEIHLGSGTYTFGQLLETIYSSFREHMHERTFEKLIGSERSSLAGSPSTRKKASTGLEYYTWLAKHYDSKRPADIIHAITGPDRNGDYYLRLQSLKQRND
jgi:hypothetical protein